MENSTTTFKCYHILVINGSAVEKHNYVLADKPEDAIEWMRSKYQRSALFFHCTEVDCQEMRGVLLRGEQVFCASHTIEAAIDKEVERLRGLRA